MITKTIKYHSLKIMDLYNNFMAGAAEICDVCVFYLLDIFAFIP